MHIIFQVGRILFQQAPWITEGDFSDPLHWWKIRAFLEDFSLGGCNVFKWEGVLTPYLLYAYSCTDHISNVNLRINIRTLLYVTKVNTHNRAFSIKILQWPFEKGQFG